MTLNKADPDKTSVLLRAASSQWNELSAIEIAARGKHLYFFAQPKVSKVIHDLWHGLIDEKKSRFIFLVRLPYVRLITVPILLLLNAIQTLPRNSTAGNGCLILINPNISVH